MPGCDGLDHLGVPSPCPAGICLRELQSRPDNVVPAWVLPMWRVIKGSAGGDLARAWAALPDHLPDGAMPPSVDEAAIVLIRLGLV